MLVPFAVVTQTAGTTELMVILNKAIYQFVHFYLLILFVRCAASLAPRFTDCTRQAFFAAQPLRISASLALSSASTLTTCCLH